MDPLHSFSMTVYMTESWPVKLLVAATPTSGPQLIVRKDSLIRAREDVLTLTMESIFAPTSLAC